MFLVRSSTTEVFTKNILSHRYITEKKFYTISFAGGCYYLSSTANPFLYSLLSKRFRRGFHDVLRYAFGRFFDPSIGHTQSTGGKNQGGPSQTAPGPALSRRRGSHQKVPLQMVPLHLTHRIRSKLTSV